MTNYEWFRQRRNVQGNLHGSVGRDPHGGFLRCSRSARWVSTIPPRARIRAPPAVTIFPGNIIPAARIPEQSRKLLDFLPTPSLPGQTNNYVTPLAAHQPRPVHRPLRLRRILRSQWFGRYSWGDEKPA